ncbi:MAG TPA: DUF4328 domain-containing protein [Acidimicrobiia bacterium]|nr:DUF4328 domain-containing protein [Acidimicrobiia bacterium]
MTQLPPPPPPIPSGPPPPPPPPVVAAVPARWRDQHGLVVALMVLFGLMLCAAGVLGAALANRLALVHDFEAGNFSDAIRRADDADDFVDAAAAFYGLVQLAIVVLFITWQFRSAKNNEALARPGARFGPGWSIGAWFIPIANLVIPVMIVQDLWRGATPSTPRGDPRWRSAPGSWLVGIWWTAWLLSLLRFGASSAALRDNSSLSDIETGNTIALGGTIATAIAAVLAALVVWTLSHRQLDTLRAQRAIYDTASGAPTAS